MEKENVQREFDFVLRHSTKKKLKNIMLLQYHKLFADGIKIPLEHGISLTAAGQTELINDLLVFFFAFSFSSF